MQAQGLNRKTIFTTFSGSKTMSFDCTPLRYCRPYFMFARHSVSVCIKGNFSFMPLFLLVISSSYCSLESGTVSLSKLINA